MSRALLFALTTLAFFFCSCGGERVADTYHFHESYSRPGRTLQNIIACDPSDRSKAIIGHVIRYKADEDAIHAEFVLNETDTMYAIIQSMANGFDCEDDKRSPNLTSTQYIQLCSELEIAQLLINREL